MKKFSAFILKYRRSVISFTLIITLILGYFLKDLKINPDITSYLPKTDPVVALGNYIGEEYGGNLLAMVALETEDVFTGETIARLDDLTARLQNLEGISYVTSLTNVLDIKSSEEEFEVGRLVEAGNLPRTSEELQALKEYTLSKEMYRGRLVSSDATATLIICRLRDDVDEVETARRIQEVVEEVGPKEKVYYGGLPFLMLEISDTILSDLKLLTPIAGLLIIILLYLSFRSFSGVILPLLSVLISTIWTLGIMSILKIPLTIISDAVPVIMIAVGSAYSIHVITKFKEGRAEERQQKESFFREALAEVSLPVFLAAITTMAGFISFVFGSYLTMIQEFGVFSSLGVFFALVTSVTFVPCVLSLFTLNLPPEKGKTSGETRAVPGALLSNIGRWILGNEKTIIGAGLIIVVLGALGIPRIERTVDLLDYFKPGTGIRVTEEEIMKKKFGGSIPIQILVRGDIQDPRVLTEMKKLQQFLECQEDIHNPQSIADLITELNAAMGEGKAIPDSKDKVVNLWFLLEGEEILQQLVKRDNTEALIQATVVFTGMDRVIDLVNKINEYIEKANSPVCSFEQTGMPYIYKNLDSSLINSQLQSLILSLALIFLVVFLLLRSLPGGLIGLAPILFTLIILFGFMGFSGIPLDVATVLVGGVSIGIGIDYSIHFLTRFRQGLGSGKSRLEVLQETLQTTGRAILINAFTVAGGFLVFLLADLVPLQRFGLLVAITMLSSGCGALILLPAVILLSSRWFKYKQEAGAVGQR